MLKKLLLLLTLAVAPSFGAIAVVEHSGCAGCATTPTPKNITGATAVLVNVTNFGSSFGTGADITDSAGNTFLYADTGTRLTCSNGNSVQRFAYVINPITSTTYTVTAHTNTSTGSIQWVALSGVGGFDKVIGCSFANLAQTTWQWGNLTPTGPNEIILSSALITNADGQTLTGFDSGLSLLDTFTSGSVYGGSLWYIIETTAVAKNPTATFSGPEHSAGGNIAFTQSSPAVGPKHKITIE